MAWDASDFLLELRRIRPLYETEVGPKVASLRQQLTGEPESRRGLTDRNLEFHIRTYVVDLTLRALNWNGVVGVDKAFPNLFPEAAVRSVEKDTTRFLDYLGVERETDLPALIVETKRPSSELPRFAKNAKPASTYSEIMSRALREEQLAGEWPEWLLTLQDYVRSVLARAPGHPKRVVITNGDWLIAFLDPQDAFGEKGTSDPNRIVVFENWASLESRYAELFLALNYEQT